MRDKDACGSDDHLIHYLEVFYCPGGGSLWPLMAACGVVWMLLLFYGMSVVAEVFLCPAVEVRGQLLLHEALPAGQHWSVTARMHGRITVQSVVKGDVGVCRVLISRHAPQECPCLPMVCT